MESGMTSYVKIHNDMWEDLGKVYRVVSYASRPNSTAIDLVIEREDGSLDKRAVPLNQLEWVEKDA